MKAVIAIIFEKVLGALIKFLQDYFERKRHERIIRKKIREAMREKDPNIRAARIDSILNS